MADEYIRREDAIDAFNRIKNTLKNPKTAHYDTLMFYEIEDVLEDVEPADVAPVVHGRWIDDGTEFGCQCSECGKSLDDYVAPTEYASLNEIPNFCPNCGAKMDGGDEHG